MLNAVSAMVVSYSLMSGIGYLCKLLMLFSASATGACMGTSMTQTFKLLNLWLTLGEKTRSSKKAGIKLYCSFLYSS